MTKQNIEYACRKKIRNHEVIDKIRKQAKDPNLLHGKEAIKALYDEKGMKLNLNNFPSL